MDIATSMVNVARDLTRIVESRRQSARNTARTIIRKEQTKQICIKRFEETERDLTQSLIPLFTKQIADARANLIELDEKTVSDQGSALANQVFDPREYDEELIDRALPSLARGMAEAVREVFTGLGINLGRRGERALGALSDAPEPVSTASQWLAKVGAELPPGMDGLSFVTEFPPWLIQDLTDTIRETFEQDYWMAINDTTRNQIETYLSNGISEGQSIRTMAREIHSKFPREYSISRARNVARTESGNSLNAARKKSVDGLKQEIPELPMKQIWLSVLGFTTRDAHADLDGMPEDSEGMWNLNGVLIPWPSHFSLPAEDRCNCLCSIFTDLGMSDAEAQQMLDPLILGE